MKKPAQMLMAAAVAWPLVLGSGVTTPASAEERDCVLQQVMAATPVAGTPLPASTPTAAEAYLGMSLTDVCTGETFALGQFEGSFVYVHPMGTW
ncbi:MAG: hypothetical protein ACKOCK_10590 [Chloroflexota bacterium]